GLRLGTESRAADLRCGATARRTFGGRLRQGDRRAGTDAQGARTADAGDYAIGSRGRTRSARTFSGGAPWVTLSSRAPRCGRWRRIRRRPVDAPENCAWLSTRIRWAARP